MHAALPRSCALAGIGKVHVKSLESQGLKTLLAARKALLRRRIDLENEARGLLKVHGFKLPARIYHARSDDMARQAVIADPAPRWPA